MVPAQEQVKSTESDRQALERFVVENDALLELEERIGRFNIFDALRVDRIEIRHSNFLAWLLDPIESHGQGALFLRAILMDLFKSARENGYPCPISPIQLDGEDLRGVEIRREWRHIDLLITCEEPKFVIAIENKIKSGEHSDQLSRYKKTVREHFPDHAAMYAFLTVEGDEPSEEDWVPYSYGDVHRVLQRVRNAGEAAIGDDVLAFLDHYLRLLRGRLMDDPKIDELCERIYKNHRQALDLIWERGRPRFGDLAALIRNVLQKQNWLQTYDQGGKTVYFIPYSWLEVLPSVREDPPCEVNQWLTFCVYFTDHQLKCDLWVCPTTDQQIRSSVVERLVCDPSEFGLRLARKSIAPKWATIYFEQRVVMKWDDDLPDEDEIVDKTTIFLNRLRQRTAGVPDALRPIVEQWQQEMSEQSTD